MIMQPVIVGWDGSRGSREALEWAARQAERVRRPLHIVLVVNTPQQAMVLPGIETPVYTKEEIAAVLAPAREMAQQVAPDVEVKTLTMSGHPVTALINSAQDARALVVGSHGHSRLYSTFLGSTSLSIAMHAPCPVVVVRGDASAEAGAPVVVGADGSKPAENAVRFAAEFASQRNAPLIAVCAMPQPSEFAIPDLIITPEYRDELRNDAERYMAESLAGISADFPDLEIVRRVTDTTAQKALTSAAAGAQLLVVGSRGRGGFTGMLLGSVSRSVLFHSPCPLAIIRG